MSIRINAGDYIFYDIDDPEDIFNHIEDSKSKDFSVFEKIEIPGIEKQRIKHNVEKSFKRIMDFLDSLKLRV